MKESKLEGLSMVDQQWNRENGNEEPKKIFIIIVRKPVATIYTLQMVTTLEGSI